MSVNEHTRQGTVKFLNKFIYFRFIHGTSNRLGVTGKEDCCTWGLGAMHDYLTFE